MMADQTIPLPENTPALTGDPEAHAEAIVRASGTSFFWAMRTLGPAKRAGMYAIYAFCREVDDIADGTAPEHEKRAALDQWREEIDRLYAGAAATNLTGRALAPVIQCYGLRRPDCDAIIDGMAMDAGAGVRIKDQAELSLYCDRVASAVGRLSNRVFGVPDALGDPVADSLGQALQRTNILRDVVEDAARDRLYIPSDMLRAEGCASEDLSDILESQALVRVCETLAHDTQDRYAEAKQRLADCDPALMRPAIVMMEIYYHIFQRLQRRGWTALDESVRVSKLQKLWLGLRFGLFS